MATPETTSLATTSLKPCATDSKQPSSADGLKVDPRRLLGAYYTPDDLASILVRWALNGLTGTILDPSFGGCAFLTASVNELARKGVKEPGHLVHGVDVDPDCMDYVRGNDRLIETNCIIRDFLDLDPSEMPGTPFKAIVGNPPFVRHHWLKGARRDAARSVINTAGVDVPATASTWAYFLVHSLSFLREGGRLAMLVPEAILQADYAAPIREALSERFKRAVLVHIRDRLFEGTDEPVVVVAAEGFGKPGLIAMESIEQANELDSVLTSPMVQKSAKSISVANGRTLPTEMIELLMELEQEDQVCRISDLAKVRIGLVTGANRHFIRSLEELEHLGIPSQVRVPVVSRTRWLSGLSFTKEDHHNLSSAGKRTFLVRPTPKYDNHEGVVRWIEEGEAAGFDNRFKCTKREQWFRVELPKIPGAFATCTRLGPPLIVLNSAKLRCSNAIHAMYWLPKAQVDPKAVVVGFLTSAVSVWAELHGRRYGGGVLKTEPGKLLEAPVPILPASLEAYDELNCLMRAGRERDARLLADRIVLGEGLGLANRDIRKLQHALKDLMSQRTPARRRGKSA